jgi:hypothetical protein
MANKWATAQMTVSRRLAVFIGKEHANYRRASRAVKIELIPGALMSVRPTQSFGLERSKEFTQ